MRSQTSPASQSKKALNAMKSTPTTPHGFTWGWKGCCPVQNMFISSITSGMSWPKERNTMVKSRPCRYTACEI